MNYFLSRVLSAWRAVFSKGKLYVLDVAARIDQCAAFLVGQQWGAIEFPSPFGRDLLPEVR